MKILYHINSSYLLVTAKVHLTKACSIREMFTFLQTRFNNFSVITYAIELSRKERTRNFYLFLNREPETQQNAQPLGSSMAERQRFGCLDTCLCSCKITLIFAVPYCNSTFPNLFQICSILPT